MYNNNNNNKIIRRNNRNNTRRNIKKRNENNKEHYTIYRNPGRFAPDKLKVVLVFQDTSVTRTVSSSNALNWAYRSSAFDPDPAVLTGSIPGFVELANLYSMYCVHKMKAEIEVCNQETEACVVVAWPSSVTQGVNSLSLADLAEYSGNVRAKSAMMGSVNGQNRSRMFVNASGHQLVGERFKTDLNYSADTSANPVSTFGINIGVYNTITTFSFVVPTKVRVHYTIEFFRLRQLET